MAKVIQHEHGSSQQDQRKDLNKAKFFSETDSVFFTTKRTPYCNLLILGDYEPSSFSKKRELLASSPYEKLKTSGGKNNAVLVGERDGITLFISDFCSYEKHAAHPAYSGATMTVIIPNSEEDLQICFNSVYNRPHKPAQDSKVVYVNLYDPNSTEHQAIELKAKELNFSDDKLVLEPVTFDRLVDISLQHSREVFDRLTQPQALVHSTLSSQGSGFCCLM